MAIDEATLRKVARLARLRVPEDEITPLMGELNKIVSFIEALQEVDVTGVEPMTSVLPANLRMRADLVKDGGYADAVLQNAPESAAGFFAVPKVVE